MRSLDSLNHVLDQFLVGTVNSVVAFGQRGNINLDTYLVHAGDHFLLQRLNTEVFTQPDRVMRSMVAWVDAQRDAIAVRGLEGEWVPIELVKTKSGNSWHVTADGEYWRLMHLIEDCVSFKSLADAGHRDDQLRLAEEMGRGLALNADLTSELDPLHVETALPGYRNTELYVQQFRSVVAGHKDAFEAVEFLPSDEELRDCTVSLFHHHLSPEEAISRRNRPAVQDLTRLITDNAEWALSLFRAVHDGSVRRTAIHGDTKIENFLFCAQSGRVQSLVDLDTVMPYTWLADWGDMVRSLCNIAGEKERDQSKVVVDEGVYEAVARGFLSTAQACPREEIEMMADAVAIIAFELGVRFFTDFLRGDNYFALSEDDPQDLNFVRGQTQLTLFSRLMERREWATRMILDLAGSKQASLI